jgi:hypothetical protein
VSNRHMLCDGVKNLLHLVMFTKWTDEAFSPLQHWGELITRRFKSKHIIPVRTSVRNLFDADLSIETSVSRYSWWNSVSVGEVRNQIGNEINKNKNSSVTWTFGGLMKAPLQYLHHLFEHIIFNRAINI